MHTDWKKLFIYFHKFYCLILKWYYQTIQETWSLFHHNAIKMWSNDNNQRNSTTKSWQGFAIERKFFLNHSVPSICDILCPKRKIGFPYVFEWVACKWLNEKNRWVCTDFCYISGKLKYINVSFHLQEIVYIYTHIMRILI